MVVPEDSLMSTADVLTAIAASESAKCYFCVGEVGTFDRLVIVVSNHRWMLLKLWGIFGDLT